MFTEYQFKEHMIGGCMFPVLDKASGKRKTLCGKDTLFSFNGGKLVMCAEHGKIVDNFVAARRRELKRGDRKPDGAMRINRSEHKISNIE